MRYRKHPGSLSTVKREQNGQLKLEVGQAWHEHVLGEEFMQTPAYKIVTDAYFLCKWNEVDQKQFAVALRQWADAYIAKNAMYSSREIYKYTADLLLRGSGF